MKSQEKLKEYRRLPKKSLEKALKEQREKLRQLRFDLAGGKVKNVREIRQARRDIARMETVSKEQNNAN